MRKLFRFTINLLGILALAAVLYAATGYIYSRHVVEYEERLKAWPDKADFKPAITIGTDNPRRARILAIEGGALFGLADLEVLKALEEKTGKPIHELFDFVAGSSTGAIISTLLLYPDPETGKPMSAAEAISAYESLSGQMLDGPLHHKILTGFGLFGPVLKNEGRIETAQKVIGEAQFRDLLRPVMFPAYSQETSSLKVFRNWDETEANMFLWTLVTAVTSVPAVFPAVFLLGGGSQPYFYGDPGLISNEPADLAYLHARTHLPDVEEFIIVSIGTIRDFSISEDIGVRGGIIDWFTPAFRLLARGEMTVSQGALKRHAAFESEVKIHLTALSPVVPGNISFFDFSPGNRHRIRQSGVDFVNNNQRLLDNLANTLTNNTAKTSETIEQN